MTKQLPGGKFADAWASLAAAAPRKRRTIGGPFPQYTTAELINDAPHCDKETREKIEAEIARRTRKTTQMTKMIIKVGNNLFLASKPPEREYDGWRVGGRRWIKSRQCWAQKGLSFVTEEFQVIGSATEQVE